MHSILLYKDLVKHYTREHCALSCLIYNTMNWSFIKEMLVALNFPHKFIKIIMTFITSTSYILMINGSPTNSFAAKRGLRQGDPLSPLLFVIGMEYLSRSLKSGTFGFHPQCKVIKLTHLCFADDLMIFRKGHLSSMRKYVLVLKVSLVPLGSMRIRVSLQSIWLG